MFDKYILLFSYDVEYLSLFYKQIYQSLSRLVLLLPSFYQSHHVKELVCPGCWQVRGGPYMLFIEAWLAAGCFVCYITFDPEYIGYQNRKLYVQLYVSVHSVHI